MGWRDRAEPVEATVGSWRDRADIVEPEVLGPEIEIGPAQIETPEQTEAYNLGKVRSRISQGLEDYIEKSVPAAAGGPGVKAIGAALGKAAKAASPYADLIPFFGKFIKRGRELKVPTATIPVAKEVTDLGMYAKPPAEFQMGARADIGLVRTKPEIRGEYARTIETIEELKKVDPRKAAVQHKQLSETQPGYRMTTQSIDKTQKLENPNWKIEEHPLKDYLAQRETRLGANVSRGKPTPVEELTGSAVRGPLPPASAEEAAAQLEGMQRVESARGPMEKLARLAKRKEMKRRAEILVERQRQSSRGY